MKPILLLFMGLCQTILLQGQVSKTVEVTAGGLSQALTETELQTITQLTLTGTINALDISTIQYQMPMLTELDMSMTTITACSVPSVANFRDNWFPGPSISKNSLNYGGLNKPLLTSLKLPSSLEVIGSGGLSGCSGLSSFTIPPTVTTIGWSAFEYCSALTSIDIPSSVTHIDQWAFYFCSGLKELILPSSITYLSRGIFEGCSALQSITIPSSVTSIDDSAFRLCGSLTMLVLPESVEYIHSRAFSESPNLASIYAYRSVPANLASAGFDPEVKSNSTLYVPFGSGALYAAAEEWKDFAHIVEMPELKLSTVTAKLEANQGSTASVELTCYENWTASCDQSWLKVIPASGTGCDTLSLIADANFSSTSRTAIVTILAMGIASKNIGVTQQTIPVGTKEINQNSTSLTCYPNPFTQEIQLAIQNPRQEAIVVDIYNMAGQRVKNLVVGNRDEHLNLMWNGTNELGQKVRPGVYICKMNGQSKQLMLVKP
ncbi:MAG TPA: leucine-rich repeat protein [Prolixibacteraceae bacterium]